MKAFVSYNGPFNYSILINLSSSHSDQNLLGLRAVVKCRVRYCKDFPMQSMSDIVVNFSQ
jgi:hypothetical protein